MERHKRGIIDIGTNSVRLLLANVNEKKLHVEYQTLEMTRLGEGLLENNFLSPSAIERTVKAVNKFWTLALEEGAVNIFLVATSAVREASNRNELRDKIWEITNQELHIIEEKDEALYSYRGALYSLDLSMQEAVVFDLGGGSTEFIWVEEGNPQFLSLPVGVVKLQEKFNLLDIPSVEKVWEAREHLMKMLEALPPLDASTALVGVGGTITTLSSINLGLQEYDSQKIHRSKLYDYQVKKWEEILLNSTLEERKNISGLMPDRADVIVSGVLMVDVIMDKLGVSMLYVSEGDLLTGYLAEKGQKIVF